jgi:hypothetical protein
MASRKILLISLRSTQKMRSKLNTFFLAVSFAGSLFSGCRWTGGPQKIPVVVDSSPLAGVEIIAPGDPRFDQEVRQIVGARSELVETLTPLLILIKNKSPHTIVAYSAEWDLMRGGNEVARVSLRMFPMAISGPACDLPHDREIRPGERWLAGEDIDFGARIDDAGGADVDFSNTAKYQAEDLTGVTAVKARLDAVIFDDGTLVGPDRNDLQRKFDSNVEDHQAVYHSISASLKAGESAEKLYDDLEQKRRQEFKQANESNHLPRPDRNLTEKLIAEQDVLGAWRNHSDNSDSLAYFSRCLKTPPFTITRKN